MSFEAQERYRVLVHLHSQIKALHFGRDEVVDEIIQDLLDRVCDAMEAAKEQMTQAEWQGVCDYDRYFQ